MKLKKTKKTSKKNRNLKKTSHQTLYFHHRNQTNTKRNSKNQYSFNQIIKSKHSFKKNPSQKNFHTTREKKSKILFFRKRPNSRYTLMPSRPKKSCRKNKKTRLCMEKL